MCYVAMDGGACQLDKPCDRGPHSIRVDYNLGASRKFLTNRKILNTPKILTKQNS